MLLTSQRKPLFSAQADVWGANWLNEPRDSGHWSRAVGFDHSVYLCGSFSSALPNFQLSSLTFYFMLLQNGVSGYEGHVSEPLSFQRDLSVPHKHPKGMHFLVLQEPSCVPSFSCSGKHQCPEHQLQALPAEPSLLNGFICCSIPL